MKPINSESFQNNLGVMTTEELMNVQSKSMMIVGLGGLGGHVADILVRLGVKHLMLVDFDVFESSNLNRQLYSNRDNIGDYKVNVLKANLRKINPECMIHVSIERIEDLVEDNLKHIDIIIDAVDSPQTKVHIAELANRLNVPLLHGACAGWYGQMGIILPGCTLVHDMYGKKEVGLEKELLNPSFTPAAIAALMVAELVKFILKKERSTINQLRLIDLLKDEMIGTGE